MNDHPDGDDELRRRLHDIPAPGARLDADAVIAGARRRRRPKTVALSSAATVAGVLIVAPLVMPGLQGLGPQDASVLSDAGASPESAAEPAPASEPGASEESGEDEAGAAESAGDGAGAGETGAPREDASGATACGLPRAEAFGLELSFRDDPEAGSVPVWVRADPGSTDAPPSLTVIEIGTFDVEGSLAHASAGDREQALSITDGDWQRLEVTTALLAADACGDGTPSGTAPVAIIRLDGDEPVAVVGTPFE